MVQSKVPGKKAAGQKVLNGKKHIHESGSFQVVEAYKTLRTNLLFALSLADKRSVVVSSAEPDAGKSHTCYHLAHSMAELNSRVLIIDADMRKPTQHTFFRLANNFGLSRLLSGQDSLEKSIHRSVAENLDLITSGPIPPNPSELLGSDNMQNLLNILEEHYDYIFLDTPPINVVSDTLVVCGRAAGVLLIARQGQTTYDDLKRAADSLKMAKSNLLGVVITDMAQQKGLYKYRSYKYKYYKYGNG